MKKFSITALLVLLVFGSAFADPPIFKKHTVTVPLRFDYYYTYDMVVEALQKLHKAYPGLTELDMVGKSEEGRAIYAMTVNNPKTGDKLDKPGIYVDGNFHGNEIQGGEVCLYLLDYLLGNYGSNPKVTALVDKKCFYVVPVVNTDGRYHFMTGGSTPHGNRSLRRPKDDDGDGLLDEDFADDLDGDGNICMMRKKDPFGNFKTDPREPRNMLRVKPGEKGEWTLLGEEGIDNDGDGRINEDEEGYVDPNRNSGYDWMPPYVQMGAGDYPYSGVGIKALVEYIMARPNIAMAWTFHNAGGLFVRGPSTKAAGSFPPEDEAVFNYLGEYGERIVPGYKHVVGWKEMYETYGDFDSFMAHCVGAYAFTGELFLPERESFKSIEEQKAASKGNKEILDFFDPEDSFERERFLFNDHVVHNELFVTWKDYNHPRFGKIQIGGWSKYSSRMPHPFMIKDMAHRNAAAVLFSAEQTPEITMDVFDIKPLGQGRSRIRVRLTNSRVIPSMSRHAQNVKLYPKDMLTLTGKDVKVVASGAVTNLHMDKVDYKEHRPEIHFLYVPGFGSAEYEFTVTGSGSAVVTYESRHAGKIKKTVQLTRPLQ